MKEEWKDIPEYEGRYKVSNKGRVKSLPKKSLLKEKILSPDKDFYGYYRVYLRNFKGKRKNLKIHRLVAMAFIQYPIPEDMVVCHNDGNRENNFLENIRIDTKNGNEKDKLIHGTLLMGEAHSSCKLTDLQIIKIIKDERKHTIIEEEYNLSRGYVSRIKNGKTRKSITSKYILKKENSNEII